MTVPDRPADTGRLMRKHVAACGAFLALLGWSPARADQEPSIGQRARAKLEAFKVPPDDGFELARELIELGPKALPAVREFMARNPGSKATPYLYQAAAWIEWNALAPEQRNRKAAGKLLGGIVASSKGARRYLKENFDAFCKVGAVGMSPALEILHADLEHADQAALLLYITPLVQLVAECGRVELVPELARMLDAEAGLEREAGAYILRTFAQRKLDIRKATPPLLEALRDSEERVARNAAQALYVQGDRAILKQVFPLLSDSAPLTRALAGELMEGLTGRDLGFQADAAPDERSKVVARYRELLAELELLPRPGAAAKGEAQPEASVPPIELSGTP